MGAAAVVWLMARAAPLLRGAGAAVCGVTLVAVGLGVVAPLWRFAHPVAALYEGRLGGAHREARAAPARDGGRYRLDIVAARGARYAVQIDIDGRTTWLRDQAAIELELRSPQRANLFVDRSDGALTVRLRPVGVPLSWVMWAAGAAVVLAVWADALCTGSRARAAPLAAAVAWGAALVAMLGPDAAGGAGRLIGAGLLAVVAGLCAGGVAAVAGAWRREMRPRRRRTHHTASGTVRKSRARNRA